MSQRRRKQNQRQEYAVTAWREADSATGTQEKGNFNELTVEHDRKIKVVLVQGGRIKNFLSVCNEIQ